MSTKPWTGGEGPAQPGPAGLLDLLRRRAHRSAAQQAPLPGAVLCDLDGLLVDSEPLWTLAEQRVAEGLGGVFTPELKVRMIGQQLDRAIGILLDGLGTSQARAANPEEVSRLLMAEMAALFARGVPLQPGAEQLLNALAEADVPLALVSSSFRPLVDAALASLGAHRFMVSVAGDEVEHGKPDPEPYLTAARAMRVVPARCVALEDAPAGLASAIAAGCACVYVPTLTSNGALPDRAVQRQSLLDVDLELLGRLTIHPDSAGGSGHQPR